MGNSIKHIRLILIVLLGVFAIGPLRGVCADTIPADLEELSKTGTITVEEFLRESFRVGEIQHATFFVGGKFLDFAAVRPDNGARSNIERCSE